MKRLVIGVLAHVDSGKTTLAEVIARATRRRFERWRWREMHLCY